MTPKENAAARLARWKTKNPERYKAMALAATLRWQAKNPEKVKLIASIVGKKWAKNNPEKIKAARKKWEKANPEKCAERCARRAARKKNLTPPLTLSDKAKIIGFYAEARAMTELSGEPYHVDHIKPLSKGGLHHPDNLQVLRGIENQRKGAKHA